jgi:hypothetical protein
MPSFSGGIVQKKYFTFFYIICIFLQAWSSEYNHSFSCDKIALVIGVFASLVGINKIIETISTDNVVYLISSFAQSAVLLYLVFYRRATYYKHREAILTYNVLSRALIYYLYVTNSPAFMSIYPLQLPTPPLQAAMHLLQLPALVLRILVSFILPLRSARLAAFVCTTLFLLGNSNRCEMELVAVPGQGRRYQEIVTSLEYALFKYIPLPMSVYDSQASASFRLNEYEACLACKNTVQIVICYVLPLTIVFVEEKVSRISFKESNGLVDIMNYSHTELIVRYLTLIPLQAGLVFHCIVLLLTLKF